MPRPLLIGVLPLSRGRNLVLAGGGQGLYATQDAGKSWRAWSCDWDVTQVAAGPDLLPLLVAAESHFNTNDGAGLFRVTLKGGVISAHAVNSLHSGSASVNVVAIHGDNAFAATEGGGIFRSTDLGKTWAFARIANIPHLSQGPPTVSALKVSPDGAVWVGTRSDGVYRSRDGGRHWVPVGLNDHSIDGLETTSLRGRITVLAATGGAGVYRTSNGGHSWTRLALPGDAKIVSGRRAGPLYVWEAHPREGGTLFRSEDQGRSWDRLRLP